MADSALDEIAFNKQYTRALKKSKRYNFFMVAIKENSELSPMSV